MREPYRTLFEGYQDHWLLGNYLTEDEPDWAGLTWEPRYDSLSSGEKALVDLAAALKNASNHLDAAHQIRVMLALQLVATGGCRL